MSRIIVTGISGGLGRLLARVLHRDYEVIGIDRRPFPGRPKDVTVHHLDIRKKRVEDIFRTRDVAAVFHLDLMHDPSHREGEHHSFNVIGTSRVLDFVQRYRIPKVVVLSSASLYGPSNTNPIFLTEDAPLMGGSGFYHIRDLVEVDMLAQSFFWKHSGIDTTILRPVHVVGPSLSNAESRYLGLPRLPVLLGFDPMIQPIHEEDVVSALVLCLKDGVKGIFNVAGPGAVPVSVIARELGRPRIPVPHPLAYAALNRLWRWRLAGFPGPAADHLRYICMVDDRRARTVLGFSPSRTLRETILSAVDR